MRILLIHKEKFFEEYRWACTHVSKVGFVTCKKCGTLYIIR